jgi:hypothetical protein
MRVIRKTRAAAARPLGRVLLAAFMALALMLEGFATQTHIHTDELVAATAAITAGAADHHNIPAKEDPAKCPICQQIWRAGQFLTPSWLTPFLLVRSASVIEIAKAERPRISRVSHNWRGRGPPGN